MKKLMVLFFASILFVGCSNAESQIEADTHQKELTEKKMETQYLSFLSNLCATYQSNINDIQNLYGEIKTNSSIIFEKDWNQKINDKYRNIENIKNQLSHLTYVPNKFINLHLGTINALTSTLDSRIEIFEGFKQMNTKKIKDGGELMQISKREISEIQTTIEKGDQ